MTRIMLDIETMGLAPGSAITSIGAVKFGGGKITERFYRRISLQSCIDAGLTMDASTVLWWMQQGDKARSELNEPGVTIYRGLLDFSIFIAGEDVEIWGNGAAYDNVLVACACKKVSVDAPWAHRKSLCYRTVKAMHPHVQPFGFQKGVRHNALDDAESQALHLMAILPYL